MPTNLFDTSSSGGEVFPILFTSSGSHTFHQACTVNILAVGSGGNGAYSSSTAACVATGGASGGVCKSKYSVNAGDTIDFIVGTVNSTITSGVDGNNGGATIVTSSNISGFTTMTAGGGEGGKSSGVAGVFASAGGAATGGNLYNYDGASQSVDWDGTGSKVTPGGTVPVYGIYNPIPVLGTSGTWIEAPSVFNPAEKPGLWPFSYFQYHRGSELLKEVFKFTSTPINYGAPALNYEYISVVVNAAGDAQNYGIGLHGRPPMSRSVTPIQSPGIASAFNLTTLYYGSPGRISTTSAPSYVSAALGGGGGGVIGTNMVTTYSRGGQGFVLLEITYV